jgi:hypothetical protein
MQILSRVTRQGLFDGCGPGRGMSSGEAAAHSHFSHNFIDFSAPGMV